MSQDTNVENLIINKLTKAQYESITNPDPTQLYFITDEGESISTLDDVSLNNIANGQILKYNATTQKWENNDGTISAISRNVGEIISSTLPLTDAGLHLLDGALLPYGIYKEFIDYIADLYAENPTANYFTDETTWQNSVTQYGVCGKFVYNATNNTVRLPKVTGIIEGTTDLSALGDLVEAGLPDHRHSFSLTDNERGAGLATQGSDVVSVQVTSWASESNSIYGNSTTVQPQTIKAFYYIVIATSTKTSIQVDIDKIATDLNGKADTDLSNVTDTAKVMMSGMAMPSDKYIDLTLGASGTTYTAPANGWFYVHGNSSANTNFHAITIFYNSVNNWDTPVVRICHNAPSAGTADLVPVKKGQTIIIEFSEMIMQHITFVYAQGSESEAQ